MVISVHFSWLNLIFHGSIPIFHGSIPIFHGSIPIFHGSIPMFHGSIPIFHGSIPIFHGSIPIFHGSIPIVHGQIPIFHGSIPIFHGSIPIDPSQTHHIAPPWLHAMQAPRDIFRCHDRGRDWSDLRCSVNQLSFPTKWGCPVVVDTNRSGLKLRIWGLYIGCEWLKHVKTSQVEIVFVPKKWEVWEVQSDL